MGHLTTTRTTTGYLAPSRSLANTVARLTNAITEDPDECSISHQFAPSQDERSALAERRDELRGLLRRADARDVAKAITGLLKAFPHSKVDVAEAAERVTAYGSELADLPLWAIEATCAAFRGGKVARESHTFAPSAAEVRIEAEKRLAPVYAEGTQIAKVLGARVIDAVTQEERARAVAQWDRIRADVFEPSIRERAEWKEEVRRELQRMNEVNLERELRAHGIRDGIKIGVDLRRLLERDGASFPQPEDAA